MVNSHPMSLDSTMIQAARNIVFTARRQDQLSSLTVKSVRKQVICDFGLDETMGDREDIKLAIRNAVNEAVSEKLPELPAYKPAEKRKRSPGDSNSIQDRGVLDSKSGSKQQAVGTEGGSRKKPRVSAQQKNKKVLDSDDGSSSNEPVSSTKKQNIRDGSPGSQTEPIIKRKSLTTAVTPMLEAEKSESELSVLIDKPPKKQRTKKKGNVEATTPSRKTTKGQKQKEPPTALDKDEATVKRLKSFVSACGVRKVWSKEFSDLPMVKQQIRRLKDILAEVGMEEKYSMEKSKSIREKRELARELNDVLEYERKAGASRTNRSRSRQTTRTKRTVGELDTESEAKESTESTESEDSSTSPVVKRKKNTASRSIMTYLANQSSDED